MVTKHYTGKHQIGFLFLFRPQDIGFVGAIGDSDTAGFASRDTNLFSK